MFVLRGGGGGGEVYFTLNENVKLKFNTSAKWRLLERKEEPSGRAALTRIVLYFLLGKII